MAVYFGVLGAVGCCMVLRRSNLARSRRMKDLYYALAWMILMFVAGLRYQVGTDYPHYVRNYSMYLERSLNLLQNPAMTVVAWISELLNGDYTTWFFIMSALTCIPVAVMLRKESVASGLSTVLFVVLCCWHTSFNIVKQSAAMAFIMLGFRHLMNRNFKRWCLFCVMGAMFHVSALLMIPVYFLIDSKVTWKRCVLLITVGIVITLAYESLFGLMGVLRGTTSESLASSYGARDLNILRVLVNCAPCVFALVLLKHYDLNDRRFCILFNLSLLNAVLNVATMGSAYLNRFALYTIPFNALFIPYLVRPFKKRSRGIIWSVLFALYTAYWAYDLYKGSTTRVFQWIFQRGI